MRRGRGLPGHRSRQPGGARVIVLALLISACAAPRVRTELEVLARGDAQMVAGNHRAAIGLYGEFLEATADDPAAPRVRATRIALDRLVRSEAAIQRLQQEAAIREQEAALRAEDLARARQELTALRAEVTRLRADLERLKTLDLQLERRTR